MPITVKAYANADDVLIAWQPNPWPSTWVGFQLERRDDKTQQVTVIANRIPPARVRGRCSRLASHPRNPRFAAASGPITASSPPTTSRIASPG